MMRMFNAREGFDRQQDIIPEKLFLIASRTSFRKSSSSLSRAAPAMAGSSTRMKWKVLLMPILNFQDGM